MQKIKKVLFISVIITLVIGCDNNDNFNVGDSYNRSEMLTYWADELIIPAYTDYELKTDTLLMRTNDFITTPNTSTLDLLRTAWTNAYKVFQYVGFYNFGPADDANFLARANVYPTDTGNIQASIATGVYDLNSLVTFDEQGFPAMDFLINGLGNDAEVVDHYTIHANAIEYKNYLLNVAQALNDVSSTVLNAWTTSYRNTYVASTGYSAASSTNLTVNAFVKYFEKNVRAGKVGIPAGVYSGGILYPEKVESFFKSDMAKILLIESVQAVQDFFNGKEYNGTQTGPGLFDYLNHLNVEKNEQLLSGIINDQFTVANGAINILMTSLSDQVNTDNIKMIEVFDELQRIVIYFKTDMMPAINVTVDYVDADGD